MYISTKLATKQCLSKLSKVSLAEPSRIRRRQRKSTCLLWSFYVTLLQITGLNGTTLCCWDPNGAKWVMSWALLIYRLSNVFFQMFFVAYLIFPVQCTKSDYITTARRMQVVWVISDWWLVIWRILITMVLWDIPENKRTM